MTRTPEPELLRGRLRRAAAGYSGRTATCEACGNPCPRAHKDRFGNKPPDACSGTCPEIARQRRARTA